MKTLPGLYLPDPWTPSRLYQEMRLALSSVNLASGTLVAANNDAHYVPITFPISCTLYAIRFAATNGTGNYDLGLYNSNLNRIASTGSTAMTAAGMKELSLPDYRVRAGDLLYGALALSNTAGTVIRFNVSTSEMEGFGWGMEASAIPLPATATPVTTTAYSVIPVFAFGVR